MEDPFWFAWLLTNPLELAVAGCATRRVRGREDPRPQADHARSPHEEAPHLTSEL